MTVAGVAIATVLSKAIALSLALIALLRDGEYCKVEKKNLRLRKQETLEMLGIGLPSCIGSLSFYFGETVVVSSVNSISVNAMTANAISAQLDRLNYTVGASVASAIGVIISQNFGAQNFSRIKATMKTGMLYCTVLSMLIGVLIVAFSGLIFTSEF